MRLNAAVACEWTLDCGPERIVEALLAPERLPVLLPRRFASLELLQLGADGWIAQGNGPEGGVRLTLSLERFRQRAELSLADLSGQTPEASGFDELTLSWRRVPAGVHVQARSSGSRLPLRVLAAMFRTAMARERLLQSRVESLARNRCKICLGPLGAAGCLWAAHDVVTAYVFGNGSTGERVEECPREGRGGEFGHSSGKRLGAGGASSSASR